MAVSTIDALYNGTSEKLTTSATGITVTGTVAATAYTGDGSALTGTGSPSIDDNGNATAITIDINENVLVGATTSNSANVGHGFNSDGFAYHTRDGGAMLRLNRLTSDGDIMQVQKNGTTVGSVGVNNSDNLYIQGNSSHAGIQFGTNSAMPHTNGNTSDNAEDLGTSNTRWKDAYLSGGIYLGGVGSANKLEDYEEGTWTPAVASATNTPTFHNNVGRYTKIGRVVTLQFFQQTNVLATFASDTDVFYITGLPFSVSGSGYTGSQGSMNAQGMHFNGDKNNQNISGQVSPSVVNAGGVALNFQVTPNAGTRGQVNHRGAKQGYIIEATVAYFTDA